MWLGRRRAGTGRQRRGCRACGVCCEMYGHDLRVSEDDLARWRAEGRYDLLLRVGEDGRIWCDPDTGEPLEDCPFLQRRGAEGARCRVHATKPALCRDYPTAAHDRRCLCGVRFDR